MDYNYQNDRREEKLEQSTDEIVRTIRVFENKWIDSAAFSNHVGSPKERRPDVACQIDKKESLNKHLTSQITSRNAEPASSSI